ncbi:hypothetical protein CFP56_039395 [Quercus suber]|uniref:Uncharacterized protein n=1 Tax=Quercus suber TaxID=58331 RepID=A0AAW0LL08_QUESU
MEGDEEEMEGEEEEAEEEEVDKDEGDGEKRGEESDGEEKDEHGTLHMGSEIPSRKVLVERTPKRKAKELKENIENKGDEEIDVVVQDLLRLCSKSKE